MEKKIVFVGGSYVSSDRILDLDFKSDKSLLDGDIVVFQIDLSNYYAGETFQGMSCLDDNSSFRLKQDCNHWRSELEASLKDGKTVLILLNKSGQVKVATGEKQFSGTGRNRSTTRIVTTFDPYEAIPLRFGSVVRRPGERVKAARDLGVLATYWHEFGAYSTYEGYIEEFRGIALLESQTGGKVVGGLCRHPAWKGSLFFIPPPDLSSAVDARVNELKQKQKVKPTKDSAAETRRADNLRKKVQSSVASQFIAAIIGLDKAARHETEMTPPPIWTLESRFVLVKETEVQSTINENLASSERLRRERIELEQSLKNAQQLKGLLFEKGKPLEAAILIALKILGFQAENLHEGDSEFDAVMLDPDGDRLIGEAEGKDDKAVNIDKLDQLERNLREDFARQGDEAPEFAKGVLFGNAYRLTAPQAREASFTVKCMLAAKRSHISLVRTTDLFNVTQYLDSHPDPEFASKCRSAIKGADGEVAKFPAIPGKE